MFYGGGGGFKVKANLWLHLGSTKSLYRNLCRCLCHSEDLYMCASVSVLLEAGVTVVSRLCRFDRPRF